jgi:sugar/nucleoside kinase (ribokinase family)
VHAKAIQVNNVVDTTGAGDFFAAGFLYGLTCGYGLEKCANIGSVLSGNVIQVVGTNLPKQQWDEIKLNINTIISQ